MEIYFDGILIEQDCYTQLDQSCLMFSEQESFKLGVTPCNSLILGIDKKCITSIPENIIIKIGEVQYGNFKIDSYEMNEYEYIFKITDGMVKFNFNYDASYLIESSINVENGVKYVTLLELLQDICSKVNITLETLDFIGKEKHISWYDNTITAREYIGYIAELNGGYARINQNGNLEIKSFSNDVKDTISIDDCDSFKIGEKHLITHILYDNGIQKFEYGDASNETIQINSNNVFITDKEDILNIYNILNNLEFYSFSVENSPIGNAVIGDCIEFTDGTNLYKTFAQFELNYFGNWLGGYKFKVNSSNVDSTTEIIGGDLDNKYKRIKTSVDRMNNKLEITIEETDKNTEKISQVTQTVDELNSKISDIADITTSAESNFATIDLYNVNQSEPIYIKIRPVGEDISYLYPADNLYPSDDLFLKDRTLRFTNNTTGEIIDYELPCDLWYYDSDNFDELILDYETQICKVNKKVDINADGSKYLLSGTTTIEYDFPKILLDNGDYNITLLGYDNAYLFARLMAQNIYTTQFATRAEVNSSISQSATEINAKVALKLDETEFTSANIILKINDSTSSAVISADKISLEGYTTINGGFSVDLEGNATMNNANITGGKIELLDKNDGNAIFFMKGKEYRTTLYSDLIALQYDPHNFLDINVAKYKYIWFVSEDYGEGYLGLNANGAHQRLTSKSNGGEIELLSPFNDNPFIKVSKDDTFSSMSQNGVWSPSFNNNSLESKKKNIVLDEGCLDLICKSNIVSFNWKYEDDIDKKHIGLIIPDEGGNYFVPDKVITHDGDAIDLYSMGGMSWKAIQEIYDITKIQDNKIKELEEKLNGIIKSDCTR